MNNFTLSQKQDILIVKKLHSDSNPKGTFIFPVQDQATKILLESVLFLHSNFFKTNAHVSLKKPIL